MRIVLLLVFLGSCGHNSRAGEGDLGQWVLVTPPAFRTALAPLTQHRRGEGFKVVVIETTNVLSVEQFREGDGTPLLARLRQVFEQHPGRNYLLLAGTAPAKESTSEEQAFVPALSGTIGRMKGKPSDHSYSLPEADGAPRLSVGRFPARSIEEVSAMVQKTLLLEKRITPAAWRSRLVLIIGNPGGGALAEMMVQQMLTSRLARLHPTWSVQRLMDIASSPFFLPGVQRLHAAIRYMEAGELFSVYLGHSDPAGLWSGNSYMMSRGDWAHLNIQLGQGVFFTCGCFACQGSGENGEGYGLTAMRNPTGPAAVIGASDESYSAPGGLAADGLLTCLSNPPFPPRLGDYWLAVQTGLARGPIDQTTFALADQFDGSGGKVPLAVQRLEHLEMWMLLGDPALRLPVVPVDIGLNVEVSPGKTITINGSLPERLAGASVQVTLERPLDSVPTNLEKLPDNPSADGETRARIAGQNHERANNYVIAHLEASSVGSRFTCSLDVPASVPWSDLVVRAYAASEQASALGALTLRVVGTNAVNGQDRRR